MVCKECGTDLKENAEVCDNCGFNTATTQKELYPVQSPEERFWLNLVIVVIGIALIVVYFYPRFQSFSYDANDVLINFIGGENEITIRDSVVAIDDEIFKDNRRIAKVTIPNSITYIGDKVFDGCTSLDEIIIPNSITYIGYDAFEGTPWLDSQTDTFVVVGDGVLIKYNGDDTHVSIPNSVKTIGGGAFSEYESLTEITIPNSVTSIEKKAFEGCDSLTKLTIPDSVTFISERAFASCDSLTQIIIPNSVATIGQEAFDGTPWLLLQADTFVIVGDDVLIKYNGDEAHAIIPNNVKYISGKAFSECEFLTKVTIPDSVISIGYGAFYKCDSLDELIIPDAVELLGEHHVGTSWNRKLNS